MYIFFPKKNPQKQVSKARSRLPMPYQCEMHHSSPGTLELFPVFHSVGKNLAPEEMPYEIT